MLLLLLLVYVRADNLLGKHSRFLFLSLDDLCFCLVLFVPTLLLSFLFFFQHFPLCLLLLPLLFLSQLQFHTLISVAMVIKITMGMINIAMAMTSGSSEHERERNCAIQYSKCVCACAVRTSFGPDSHYIIEIHPLLTRKKPAQNLFLWSCF